MGFLENLFLGNTSEVAGTDLNSEKYDNISARLESKKGNSLLKHRGESRPSAFSLGKHQLSDNHIDSVLDEESLNRDTTELEMRKYKAEEVLEKATEYFGGDEMVANVWMNKYALRDAFGNLYELTPDDMHQRIASEFARIEQKYPNPIDEAEINYLLKDFQYIVPQGSPMFGIGNLFQIASLSNCFVIGQGSNSDSYGSIMKTDEEQVQLMKRRGGVGHDLSHIRPEGSLVNNSALTSTGIVPFMERFSNSTREVAQGGRRGALMLSISIKHPDAEKFIDAKLTAGKITGANVSVRIDDEFMQCVKTGKPYIQQYPVKSSNPSIRKEVDARVIWNKIIHNAWQSAEPGILFWDTILNESIPDSYADFGFETVSTNPCGEIPLCTYDSCRLLALNLYSYVDNPFTDAAAFNFEKFKLHVQIAQRLMDDLIDLEAEKIDTILEKVGTDPEGENIKRVEKELWTKIKEKTLLGRRTGLGITAEGDMLAALNIRYGSEEAIAFSTEVHKQLALAAYRSSVTLAKERGKFNVYNTSKEAGNPFIKRLREADPELYQEMMIHGRRNIALLTVAPTGSVSICTQTTSGIEPVFMIAYTRRRKVNPSDENVKISFTDANGDAFEEYQVLHPKFKTWAEINGYDAENLKFMTTEELNELIEQSPYHNATAHDIDWVMKVKLQGAVQKWVDHSISVTVNIPKEVTENIVSEIYQTAWESGCKGMTIYRDGSRDGVLVSNDKKSAENGNSFIENNAPKRPEKIEADVVRFRNKDEEWIAVVGLFNNHPYEIFTGQADSFYLHPAIKKGWVVRVKPTKTEPARYDFHFEDQQGYSGVVSGLSRMFKEEYWNYAKLISAMLRHGMPVTSAVNLIANLRFDDDTIMTWKKGVARALKKYIKEGTKVKQACPECKQETLVFEGGCVVCKNCGHSKCD